MIIDRQLKYQFRNTKIIQQQVARPECTFGGFNVVFGIDPGNRHMGLTILQSNFFNAQCFEITFPTERLVIPRATQIRLALSDIIFMSENWLYQNILVAIEGSSFASAFRNTELAEARLTAALWFKDNLTVNDGQFIFIPPLTVRKQIFGSGKIKAEQSWPDLKPDAASSLAVALAGLKLYS